MYADSENKLKNVFRFSFRDIVRKDIFRLLKFSYLFVFDLLELVKVLITIFSFRFLNIPLGSRGVPRNLQSRYVKLALKNAIYLALFCKINTLE